MLLKDEAGEMAKWKVRKVIREKKMENLTTDSDQLTELFKQAIIEAMEEKKM